MMRHALYSTGSGRGESMAIRTPVIDIHNHHMPLSATDVFGGDTLELSADPDNILTLGADGGLFTKSKGAWSSRLRPQTSGTYDAAILDGTTGEFTAGYVHAYGIMDTAVVFNVDISKIPKAPLFDSGDVVASQLARYKVAFIVAWGLRGQVAFSFSDEVYLPTGEVGTYWNCTATSAQAARGSTFFELRPVFDLTRPILIASR